MQNISDNFNGITESINTLIGAIISFSLQYVEIDWKAHDELIFSISSALIALFLISISQTNFKSMIALNIQFCSATIAEELDSASYGFIFGSNTFVAILLGTIITFTFADKHGFARSIREQFFVYSGYFGIIVLIFIIIIACKYTKQRRSDRHDIDLRNNDLSYDNNTLSLNNTAISKLAEVNFRNNTVTKKESSTTRRIIHPNAITFQNSIPVHEHTYHINRQTHTRTYIYMRVHTETDISLIANYNLTYNVDRILQHLHVSI
uniref:Na_Ca_ex domain-containing protein n=1 Tax=Elaeophora elaphi TaxID=1147741 RepID=A0A0R3RUY1_9BILA